MPLPTPKQWEQAREALDGLIGWDASVIRIILNSEYTFEQLAKKADNFDGLLKENATILKTMIGMRVANAMYFRENEQQKKKLDQIKQLMSDTDYDPDNCYSTCKLIKSLLEQ